MFSERIRFSYVSLVLATTMLTGCAWYRSATNALMGKADPLMAHRDSAGTQRRADTGDSHDVRTVSYEEADAHADDIRPRVVRTLTHVIPNALNAADSPRRTYSRRLAWNENSMIAERPRCAGRAVRPEVSFGFTSAGHRRVRAHKATSRRKLLPT